MTSTSLELRHEINDLILEQIHTLSEPADLSKPVLFEYHLRHQRIMPLYRELDRIKTESLATGIGSGFTTPPIAFP